MKFLNLVVVMMTFLIECKTNKTKARNLKYQKRNNIYNNYNFK